jgi:hypothetical protein
MLMIGVLMASSACAQTAPATRRHAAAPPPAPVSGPATPVTGVVKDASNGLPIQLATATYGSQTTRTNANGEFVLNLPTGAPVTVSVQHPAFLPFQKSITPAVGGKYDFGLTGQPSVTIKTVSGTTYIVDIGSAQFAYAMPFSSYVPSDTANFCKPDGSVFTPNKTEFKRIIGPATPSTLADCCEGSLMTANAELKSGVSTAVFFKDSCHATEVDFAGREKSTGLYRYVKFTDIAEIDFP